MNLQNDTTPHWSVTTRPDGNIMTLSGDWVASSGLIPSVDPTVLNGINHSLPLCFLTDHIGRWDSGLILFLWDLKQTCANKQIVVDNNGLPQSAIRLLDLLPEAPQQTQLPQSAHHIAPLSAIGTKTIDVLSEVGEHVSLAAQTAVGALRVPSGRSGMRMVDLLSNMREAGPSALIIVSIVNFLVGAILAFVGAIQLRKFAAEIYVANLVAVASIREMSAIMTAIIMAGRTGGAYAARIATMQGGEEIDALRVFGIPVSGYLLLPAILSLVIMMPVLYLYGCLVAMFGGYVVAGAMLNVTAAGYWHQTFASTNFDQFIFGFLKTITFAAMIGLTSCRIGLLAGRRAADVGSAATRAVVVGIVGIITLDAIFAVAANAVGF